MKGESDLRIPKGFRLKAQGWRFFSQPWVSNRKSPKPQRGFVQTINNQIGFLVIELVAATPLGLLSLTILPQGWLENANPGL